MAVNHDPKCRQCRREGMKLYLKGSRCYTKKCQIERRPYGYSRPEFVHLHPALNALG